MYEVKTGNCIEILKEVPDESVNCIVTSPPYYGLRDYGTGTWVGGEPSCPHRRLSKRSDHTITGHAQSELEGNVGDAIYKSVCPLCGAVRVDEQIGLEETPQEYIQRLVLVFRECKRILKNDGTLWVNIGDSYAGTGSKGDYRDPKYAEGRNGQSESITQKVVGCKQKDMIGIPWMLAFALRDDGWYLRQDIIWHKANPMPEPVKDRCTRSHEYIFLLSKSPRYYYDYESIQECAGNGKYEMRNKRDVWDVASEPVKEAHFATFPTKLIEPCILAGSPEGGTVLDPFCESGTTGIVSIRNQRNFIGVELNPEYAEMSMRRISDEERQGFQIKII